MRLTTLMCVVLVLVLGFSGEGHADMDPIEKKSRQGIDTDEIRKKTNLKPSAKLARAVKEFEKTDLDAEFSFYLGHVDQFTTLPKNTIPDYALKVLKQAGLTVDPVEPAKMRLTKKRKRGQSLDRDLSKKMPTHYEQDETQSVSNEGKDDKGEVLKDDSKRYSRVEPSDSKPEPLWLRPSDEQLQQESKAAKAIFSNFLKQYQRVFEISSAEISEGLPNLVSKNYTVGQYVRKARYKQKINGQSVIGGDLMVLFDHNWNVITVSRMVANAEKLSIKPAQRSIAQAKAVKLAIEHIAKKTGSDNDNWSLKSVNRGIDPVRRHAIWVVNLSASLGDGYDNRIKLNAETGEVLNVSDNVDRFGDAKVRRWGYPGGDLQSPRQYVSENFYTRDNNNLVHDFFHIVTDGRGGGDPEVTCTSTSEDSLWYEQAYDSSSGSSYIRPTSRNDRDFSLWQPYSVAGSFSESNSYYWARWFFQWIKGSISDLGELPSSSSDYQQVMIVTNACISAGGLYQNGGSVTTLNDQGEGNPVIKLPEKCKRDNPNCSTSDYNDYGTFTNCEGDGCSSPPSVIHHEINHFLLKQYYDVQSGIDCSIGEELKHLHEGILGSVIPQAYWNHYYNVGYDPAFGFMYKVHYDAGLVHSDNSTNRTLSDYACDDDGDPYKSGRVAGQVMWEILHGNSVNGNIISSMPRPATDRDFLNLSYWAAELVDTSTFKDRYEYANRVMQIMEQNSSLSSSGKGQWCDAWEHHELDNWILSSYCS